MSAVFWGILGLLAYSYVGYGLLLIVMARFWPAPKAVEKPQALSVTLLIAAHNEAGHIGQKLTNALSLDTGVHKLEIVVVSDGSTDGTVEEVRRYSGSGVRLIEIKEHKGKIFALNKAISAISSDISVFSDANSAFRHDALTQLLRHFGNPEIGGVCGRIVVPRRNRNWLGRGESIYWKYDHALKVAESRIAGAVSAQGSLYAVRTELLSPLPSAVADDLLTSLRVVAQGKRLIFEPAAVTEEGVSDQAGGELQRRIRSTERGWRGLMTMTQLLNPLRYGFYSLQLFSHKVLRRLTPFLLLLLAAVTLALAPRHDFFAVFAALQAGFYGIAALTWAVPALRRVPGFSLALFFVMGHVAMGLGVANVVRGQRTDRWSPVRESN